MFKVQGAYCEHVVAHPTLSGKQTVRTFPFTRSYSSDRALAALISLPGLRFLVVQHQGGERQK